MIQRCQEVLAHVSGSWLVVSSCAQRFLLTKESARTWSKLLILFLELIRRPEMYFSVVSSWNKYCISWDWIIVCKRKPSDKLLMCIDLKQRLSLRYAPHYNLSIRASRYHLSQIKSVLGQNRDTIRVVVQSLEEGLGKYLFQLSSVESSLVLPRLLERVHSCVWWISKDFLDFGVSLLLIFFFISANCFYFYHFWCVLRINLILIK